jgi:glycosyltransferase involved in cell wall biosynthesis
LIADFRDVMQARFSSSAPIFIMNENVNIVSVVVPTYNRGEALGPTLDRLLATDRLGLGEVEIVVVDDGSPVPADPIVNARQPPPGFTLKCVRQENAGPAAARNLGFTASRGDIVIFIDDDILVPPELVRQHVEAHELNPGSVIFGLCVLPASPRAHINKVLELISGKRSSNSRFEPESIISSQHSSVERRDFLTGVYASHLRIPAAEEFDLSARLRQRGMAIFSATEISAVHDQPLEISYLCDQQYKHGMGCAEAVCKLPGTLIMDELAKIAALNGPVRPDDPLATKCKKMAKALVAIPLARQSLVLSCRLTGRVVPSHHLNAKLLWLVIAVFFFAGYRDGVRRFGPS